MPKLREKIDQHCKKCIYDSSAAGSWRQQVTLCSVKTCEFHDVRPKTSYPIPNSVLTYYGAKSTSFERKFDE